VSGPGVLVAALAAVTLVLMTPGVRTEPAPTQPARIIALSPHLAELVFDAGAGAALVGGVDHTDHPEAARHVARVGDAFRIDRERVARLQPTLILAWGGGTPRQVIERLRSDGYRVEVIESDSLEAVAGALTRIGELAGTGEVARGRAQAYLRDLRELRLRYGDRPRLRVFFQIAERPLYTVTAEQTIGQLIELCGGTNVFRDLPGLAPVVSVEAVVAADPEVILATADSGAQPLSGWRRFPGISAVRDGYLYTVDSDLVSRATLRLVDGAREICARLERARQSQPFERPRS
jgi:iron complex transport system substrate-binding protein